MKLQEVLNYRDKCIICQKEMIYQYHGKGAYKLKITKTPAGLRINSGHKYGIMYFLYNDGAYILNKQPYSIYHSPLVITKTCPTCSNGSEPPAFLKTLKGPVLLKSRSVGMTNMVGALTAYFKASSTLFDNIKNNSCFYSFVIETDGKHKGKYEISLLTEILRYHNDEKFWHLNTNFVGEESSLYSAEFMSKLEDMLLLKLPQVNTSNIKTIDQFLNKIKLYSLFS